MTDVCERCGRSIMAGLVPELGECWASSGNKSAGRECREAAAAFKRGLRAGVEMAKEHAWVSTWDGWHVTSPTIEWKRVEAALEKEMGR